MVKGRIERAVFAALDRVNELLPKHNQLHKNPNTILLDPTGVLDSLGLVNLVVAVEEEIEKEFAFNLNLTAQPENSSALKTVRSLTEYISVLLENEGNRA